MHDIIPYKNAPDGHRAINAVLAGAVFAFVILLLCIVCAMTYSVARFFSGTAASTGGEINASPLPIIVIDAGHGGIDGGAVGVNGIVEKEINLAVTKKLAALFKLSGMDFAMTREDDRMLVDDSVTEKRKMHDLKNRIKILDEITKSGREAVLVSIHMNNFSSPKYSGLQVWYSKNNGQSADIASYVQSYARTWLDTANKRETKAATSAIFLLDRATVPAILVECGFLSNPEECAKLSTDEYRTEIAVVIYAALCDYLDT